MAYAVQGAAVAPLATGMFTGHFRRLLVAVVAIALAMTLVAIQSPGAAQANAAQGSQGARIVNIAETHLGARFRMGSEGMRSFDCSGLVYRVYAQAGLLAKIGGKRMLAAQYYHWFKSRGLANRSNPKPGDLVWWTHKGRISHMGLYIGNGKALSALINPWGVKIHHLGTIHAKFFAFGHVKLS